MATVKKLSMIAIGATFLALGTNSAAEGAIIGGKIFSTGGEISVQVLPAEAGLTSNLSLYSPGAQRFIATNRDVGKVVNLGSFQAGLELIFGIFTQGKKAKDRNTFLMGEGSRNPDGIAHAAVAFLSPGVAIVGFEDKLGGGDLDYDDNTFRFTGAIANTPDTAEAEPVPEPTTVLGTLAFGAVVSSWRMKRKQQQKVLNSTVA
ncbi:MAG: PEP-CTERM sorting domain-containing protein [Microcoleus sp.]